MTDRPGRAEVTRRLQAAAREHALAERVDRLERDVARLGARLDGATVTLLPAMEVLRPPMGPDPSRELQRLVARRSFDVGPGDGSSAFDTG
jgi:hypothetical protein